MRIYALGAAVVSMMLDVAQFWKSKLFSWWRSKSPKDRLLHTLATARTFEEWEEAAFQLDEVLSTDLWRQNATSRHYDYRLILGRLDALIQARENEDILTLVGLLRSGLVRNLGNITCLKLYRHAYAGTKLLIDEYVTQVALSIQYVTSLQTVLWSERGFTSQAKLELLHDTRQSYGRTTLLLQGGSMFGLCHIGVVKALHLQGLLPRIITGTATGALIAALVGVHTEDELLHFLDGGRIDLSAFERRQGSKSKGNCVDNSQWLLEEDQYNSIHTLLRRLLRYLRKGDFLDIDVLAECVRANVGDLTFEEAYARSKRILNITVATSNKGGPPNLLNYLTAPNVLIWSAAVASNVSSDPVTIYCKDETGSIVPWSHAQDIHLQSRRHPHHLDGESSLSRIAELFNVNHFIVSQARPYLIPFLRPDLDLLDRQAGQWSLSRSIMRLVTVEAQHRLRQIDYLGLLPARLSRLLTDEAVPHPSLTLIPDLSMRDFARLFQTPTRKNLVHWIVKGERGVWPAVSALKVRCAIEIELDRAYQIVRRRRSQSEYSPVATSTSMGTGTGTDRSGLRCGANESASRKRRASSTDQDGVGVADTLLPSSEY